MVGVPLPKNKNKCESTPYTNISNDNIGTMRKDTEQWQKEI